jgi:hypothetical protein
MKASGNKWTGSAVIALVVVIYVLTYMFSTEVFNGRTNITRYQIRLFQSETHRRAFLPLTFLERLLAPRDREFSSQTWNHASLPPPE